MKFIILISFIILGWQTHAQQSLSDDAFFVGHSLVNSNMPTMLRSAIISKGGSGLVNYQVINGSPLQYNWDHGASAEGMNARTAIPNGSYEALIITEAIPLRNHIQWSSSNQFAFNYYNLAINRNPNARVYLYETWHCINSGTPTSCAYDSYDQLGVSWRQRLNSERTHWLSILNYVNSQKGSQQPNMLMVPAGYALGLLSDEINAGRVPSLSSIFQLFSDDIHLTDQGNYFIAMVQFATIYGRTPVGITNIMNNTNGSAYNTPSAALALKMQEIAWQAVCESPYSGVNCDNQPNPEPTPDPTPTPTPDPTPTPPPVAGAPTAILNISRYQTSRTFNIDGAGSSDTNGSIVRYDYNFGDNTTGSGMYTNHTYSQDGTYTVTLTVTDNEGNQGSTSVVIQLGSGNPTPEPTPEPTPTPDPTPTPPPAAGAPTAVLNISRYQTSRTFNIDGAGSRDTNGSIVRYDYNFGDGRTGSGMYTNHTYAQNGTYTVTLTVTDNNGNQTSTSAVIQVN